MLHSQSRPTLSPRERRMLQAVAAAAMPAGRILPAAGASVTARAEEMLGASAAMLAGVRAILWSLDGAAWLSHGGGLADLPASTVQGLLQRWRVGDYVRRNALRALMTPLKVLHYSDPAYFEAIRCTFTPPQGREERPRWMSERILSAADVAGETLECDVVVIGTGAGGAVVGKELAEQGMAVVFVEEGEYHGRSDFNGNTLDMQQKLYRDMGATFTLGNAAIWLPLGKSVGGSTTINSGTCYRTPERVFASWRERFGLREFSSESLAPYYDKVESILGVAKVTPETLGGVARVIARGADALGYSHQPLRRNAPDCDGQGLCCFGCPTDAKRSTNVSYIPLALRAGATVVKGVRADRVLIEHGRAVGIEAHAGAAKVTVRARAVVVACGSLLTPVFLEKNGLCGGSGQLGRNLSIHPATGAIAVYDEAIEGYHGVPQGYAIEEFHDEGILYEGAFAPPDVGSAGLTLIGQQLVEVMDAYDRVACFGFMIEDQSRGRVRVGPGGRPLVTYVLGDNDVSRLKRGMEILFRVFFAGGARRIYPMVFGFDTIDNEADLARFQRATLRARHFELSAYHPLGTARMGRDPASSVVDPDHQAHDVPGLFIVDGSVVPSSLAVNPQETIMALATRAADRIAHRLN